MRLPASVLLVWLTVAAVVPVQAAADLQLELSSDHGLYLEGASSEIYVEARISAAEAGPPEIGTPPAPAAAPRNLVLVLDRSGSMAGAPVQHLRGAVLDTLAALADHDTIAIITFGSEVETVIEATRVDQARALTDRIARIEPAGGAALYDAISQGAAQLRRYAATAGANDLVVLTDGPATRGPREADDFLRQVAALTQEGFRVSTIGLGNDFDEDLLAALARTGRGRFTFAAQPAELPAALAAAVHPQRRAVARLLSLRLDFRDYCNALTAHGWTPATATTSALTAASPYLTAGQTWSLVASATLWNTHAANGHLPDAVTATLTWQDADAPADAPPHTLVRRIALRFIADRDLVRDSVHLPAFRRALDSMVTDGMQEAIERIDAGEFDRALRVLRRTRTRVRDYAIELADPAITEKLGVLDRYLNEVEARGLNQLDRKLLRSGLTNRFDPPLAAPGAPSAPTPR